MLVGKSKEANNDIHDGERHEPDVRRMPGVVLAGRGRSHDVGQVLYDLLLEFCGNLRVAFVLNHVFCGHHVAGGLDELDRHGGERQRGLVGQLVGVLDEVLRKDPMSECSGYQVKNGQRSFLTMGSLCCGDPWNRFKFEVSLDGLRGEIPQNSEWESKDIKEAESR